MIAGRAAPSPEQPARVDALVEGALRVGCMLETPRDHGRGPLATVHTAEYLAFLETIHARWSALPDAAPEVRPNVHPDRSGASYPASPVGLAGYHQADMACPIGPETWLSAYWSAQCAITATDAVLDGARAAYALCRPPGHHATRDMAGGFCFLNNAAIAAERASAAGRRVAVLDIDVHHGNGTQAVFYERGDVLTVSIHTDPASFYPFFRGHAQERGAGAGLGATLNLPLPRGAGDAAFLDALETACARLHAFGTDALILALGLDAHASDPFKGMAVTSEGFARIGQRVAQIGAPTVLVQEGGYLSPALGEALERFLSGFGAA